MTTEGNTADLNEILRSTVQSREVRADKASIAFQFDLAQSLPKVGIDSREIERALLTVITNAEDAISGHAARPGRIHLKTAIQGNRIQVTVTDNGRGMDWLEVSRLFGEESRAGALTNCAEALKGQGGDLYAWSTPGQGSIFTLEFPIEDA